MPIDSEIKERSTYLVGFLAAIFGLAAFKDELSAAHLTVLGQDFTLLQLSIPPVIMLLAVSYLGAVAYQLGSFTITSLPVARYVGYITDFFTVMFLVYPWLLLLVWLAPAVSQLVLSTGKTWLSVGLNIVTFAAAVAIGFFGARMRAARKVTERASLALEETPAPTAGQSPELTFMQEYELLVRRMTDYLQIIGYAVKPSNAYALARTLRSKGLLEPDDVKAADAITKARNKIAHAGEPEQATLATLRGHIANLRLKIEKELYKLIVEDE